jgi:hypothetical protein
VIVSCQFCNLGDLAAQFIGQDFEALAEHGIWIECKVWQDEAQKAFVELQIDPLLEVSDEVVEATLMPGRSYAVKI